jgi:hypothetical protein
MSQQVRDRTRPGSQLGHIICESIVDWLSWEGEGACGGVVLGVAVK